jgi:hypothetical protein
MTGVNDSLASIRQLLSALALISETLEEPGAGAVNVIVHAALAHVAEAEGTEQCA